MAVRLYSQEELEEADRSVTLKGTFTCPLEDFNIASVLATHDAQRTLPL